MHGKVLGLAPASMSIADVLVGEELTPARAVRPHAGADALAMVRASWLALAAVVLVAPFETLRPLVRLPGQSLTSVEAVVVACVLIVALTAWRGGIRAGGPIRLVLPQIVLGGVAIVAALAAPAHVGNALRMSARLLVVAFVSATAIAVGGSAQARRRMLWVVVVSGVVVALLTVADFAGGTTLARWFAPFRTAVAIVGTQVRASGPFQYPTIASMYMEIAFAAGCGLLLTMREVKPRLALVLALIILFEGIVLTFTRAGLITAALALGLTAVAHWRQRGPDAALRALALVGLVAVVQIGTSRSAEMLMLRLTSEGQGRWFSAVFDVPSSVAIDTQRLARVPISVTNTGRATWDSDASEPVLLSYHWVALDSDEVVAWEGERTAFPVRVAPGQTMELAAVVGGPGRPGRFRLMWDIEQENRLWFSTEPDAAVAFSTGVVSGPVTSTVRGRGPHRIPRAEVRPGRFRLWAAALRMVAAHPLLGVGPDNYRLLYGEYSTIVPADPRVHSNNMYIEVLAGMGMVGAAVLLWVAVRTGRAALAAWRLGGEGAGIGAACAAIAVHGLVDSFLSFTGTYLLMAVMIGLAMAHAGDAEAHAHRV
ncbi:MAG: O-antigen ligase family protein [Vicinamibacterales bacterium]